MDIIFKVKNKGLAEDLTGLGGNSPSKHETIIDTDGNHVLVNGSTKACEVARILLKDLAEEKDDDSIIDEVLGDSKRRNDQVLFSFDEENLEKIRDLLGVGSNAIERQTVSFKDGSTFDEEGTYLYISGNETACENARKVLKEAAEEVEGEKGQNIISKIKEQEDAATEGFGGIFG